MGLNKKRLSKGFRGYAFSRPFFGHRIPQHIQNTIIRDYCKRNELNFLLSVTEYKIANSHLMLDKVMRKLDEIDGLVFYSIFQLPYQKDVRKNIMEQIVANDKSIHFASEKIILNSEIVADQIEMMLQVENILPFCPNTEDIAELFLKSSTAV